MKYWMAIAWLAAASASGAETLRWTQIEQSHLEGQAFRDTKAVFDRLPAKAEAMVRPPVWSLSRNSAGLSVRFFTDASEIHARWTLRGERLALPHMPATGVSGLDLYVRHEGKWRWLANGRPEKQFNEQAMVQGWTGGQREYMLYLPLYNGVEAVSVGVSGSAKFAMAPKEQRRPILFYGTSILQGGCASRPGMAYPAIIGRMLDYPTYNFGFSGNALSEPEMSQLFAEVDASVYVYDSLPNLSLQFVKERTEPFLRALRKAHPHAPIVIVENVIYTNALVSPARGVQVKEKNDALRAIYEKLKSEGMTGLSYVPGGPLLGDDGEGTVDGAHPTDAGFLRMAETIAPVLRPLVRK